MNEFASQPTPGQASESKIRSDTDSTGTDSGVDLDISGVVSSESDFEEESLVIKHREHFKNSTQHPGTKKSKMSDQKREKLADQALINQQILSQLDEIGKRLIVINRLLLPGLRPKN